jgi:hypothetical protein
LALRTILLVTGTRRPVPVRQNNFVSMPLVYIVNQSMLHQRCEQRQSNAGTRNCIDTFHVPGELHEPVLCKRTRVVTGVSKDSMYTPSLHAEIAAVVNGGRLPIR